MSNHIFSDTALDIEHRQNIKKLLRALGFLSEGAITLEDIEQLSAALRKGQGVPDQLLIDINAFEALKSIKFDPSNLKP